MQVLTYTDFEDMQLIARGKVRDIYDLGEHMLIVTTDRLSAFDVVFDEGIPYKGHVLTMLSEFWFEKTASLVENHLVTTDVDQMPEICQRHKDLLKGRSMLVKKAKPYALECVARGYITGSGWKDYKKTGTICGLELPLGLQESQKLPMPVFTPSTKALEGLHDENISYAAAEKVVGADTARELKNLTIALYSFAADFAMSKGIIIADTKFEFGIYDNKTILIDEALTPDSSRFWRASSYEIGKGQDSMDKQVVRDYLEGTNWDKNPPAPALPKEVAQKASERYCEIMEIIIG